MTLVGVCTGSFVLARAGLMTGRRCCVSWYHRQDFLAAFPHHVPVADRLFVDEGDRITCSGGGGVSDLATLLVERHLGRAVAQKTRHVLLLDRPRAGSEAQPHPPVADTDGVRDERVRRALLLMEQNLADPLPVATIAEKLRLSTRQLERLFQAVMGERPGAFYRRLRPLLAPVQGAARLHADGLARRAPPGGRSDGAGEAGGRTAVRVIGGRLVRMSC